jgi:hypothetical protein
MAEISNPASANLYGTLGLTSEATVQEIRAAYQHLVGEIQAGAVPAEQRPAIEEAFETLGDPIRRLRYDARSAAPPPSRIQRPDVRLPGIRISLPTSRIRAAKRPVMPKVDPLLAGAVALVALLALVVLLLPILRGSRPSAPAQSVSDVVPTQTATTVATASATAAAVSAARSAQPTPILGLPPGAGTSLLPITPGLGQGALVAPPQPAQAQGTEPLFLTQSAVIDMLRAVLAATAVRNGPSTGSLPAQAVAAPPGAGNAPAPINPGPAGIPITSVGAVPPVIVAAPQGGSFSPPAAGQPSVSAGQPSVSAGIPAPAPQGTLAFAPASPAVSAPTPAAATQPPPTPTPRPAPNHILVPSGPAVTASGQTGAGARPSPVATVGGSTGGPNRIVPATAGPH